MKIGQFLTKICLWSKLLWRPKLRPCYGFFYFLFKKRGALTQHTRRKKNAHIMVPFFFRTRWKKAGTICQTLSDLARCRKVAAATSIFNDILLPDVVRLFGRRCHEAAAPQAARRGSSRPTVKIYHARMARRAQHL